MYICVCNAVTDGQIRQCLDQGMNSLAAIKRQLEFKSCCGRCSCLIRELIRANNGCRKADAAHDSAINAPISAPTNPSNLPFTAEQTHAR